MDRVLHFFEKLFIVFAISAVIGLIAKSGFLMLHDRNWLFGWVTIPHEISNIIFAFIFTFFAILLFYISGIERPNKPKRLD